MSSIRPFFSHVTLVVDVLVDLQGAKQLPADRYNDILQAITNAYSCGSWRSAATQQLVRAPEAAHVGQLLQKSAAELDRYVVEIDIGPVYGAEHLGQLNADSLLMLHAVSVSLKLPGVYLISSELRSKTVRHSVAAAPVAALSASSAV